MHALLAVCVSVGVCSSPTWNQDEILGQVSPEVYDAWQSLVQVRTVNISELSAPTGQKEEQHIHSGHGHSEGHATKELAKEDMTPRIKSLPALLVKAMTRVASQDFDPFPTNFIASNSSGKTQLANSPVSTSNDVFSPTHGDGKDIGLAFFHSAPGTDWLILLLVCVVLFLVDLLVLQRFRHSFKTHALTLVFWFMVAIGFNALTLVRFGHEQAFNWATGYCLEWILSMDNLFVFHLVFETYKTPKNQTHRAVFLGIIGAVLIRLVFFMVVSTLLHFFYWVRFPFGVLLIWSGVQAARGDDDDFDVDDTYLVKSLKWLLGRRLSSEYDPAGRMIVRGKQGQLQVTLLAMVVACLEVSDVVFALDSVSAKIAQISDEYIAFSSTVIAMYGLRAMFFIIKDLVEMFELLQYGLCLILVFIGLELMFAHWIKLPSSTVCIMIVSVFAVFTFASMARSKLKPTTEKETHSSVENAQEDR